MSKPILALLHRHGQTVLNKSNVFRSHMEPPLDDMGWRQAEQAADFLERYEIERIVTSPMLRAWQTAMAVRERFQHLRVEQERMLKPWDLGFMAGKDREDYQDLLEYYIENSAKTPPEGECLDAMKKRTEEYFKGEFDREEGLACYVCHTSNIVTLNNLINGNDDLKPEIGEAVGPGGIAAIIEGPRGLEMEVLWGEEKKPEYGVS